MRSSSDLAAAPLYLEMAPPLNAASQINHLFVFRDMGVLSGRGSGRFASDLFTLSITCDDSGGARGSLAPPRPGFTPRRMPFHGVMAGLRLSSRPERLPEAEELKPLASALARVQQSDEALPLLVTMLDELAKSLRFAASPGLCSARTERRKVREETGVSRRRLVASRRFRRLLGQLATQTVPLTDLALDAGYYDQPHMSAACRAFAGKPPRALRLQAAQCGFGRSLQDARLKDRLILVINE
ncbi:helix-turn-helix domain-containing protein [Nioella nitratireducens]|jgi:AraC-type DNA-binding domain-containing proteins|uniref:helix-turn-helix domain-containing protein n=1 Tax=Nioella nitratireducens TaxID=1287720 RepID=UPI0008FD708F|nr:helix-turn-helix domain-containing protein [Nioella nitratireducens]